MLYKLKEAVI